MLLVFTSSFHEDNICRGHQDIPSKISLSLYMYIKGMGGEWLILYSTGTAYNHIHVYIHVQVHMIRAGVIERSHFMNIKYRNYIVKYRIAGNFHRHKVLRIFEIPVSMQFSRFLSLWISCSNFHTIQYVYSVYCIPYTSAQVYT